MSIFGNGGVANSSIFQTSMPQPNSMILKVAKQEIGLFSKFRFFISRIQGHDSEQKSETYNIENLATVSFHFKANSSQLTSNIIVQKHDLAKDNMIKVKISCKEPCYSTEWICTDNDILREIGEIKCDSTCGNANMYLLEVSIYVSKIESLFAKLYEDSEFTDFNLSTDEGFVVVHKACLVVHSEVFKVMLSGEWKETSSGHVKVKEVSLQTLQDLKRYMYLGTLPDEGLRPLLLLAMCYLIENLKAQCIMKLAQTVTAEDLYSLLEFSMANKIPELTFAILMTLPEDVAQGAQQIINRKNLKEEPDTQTNT